MRNQVNGCSILRVVATLMVLMVHFGQSLPLPKLIIKPIQFGSFGVVIFFVLSGYLIAMSLEKNNSSVLLYYKKRVLRIIPPYYMAVLVSMVGLYSINAVEEDFLHIGWMRYIFFLQTLLPSNNYNLWNNCSALWTLSAFFVFYLLAPFFRSLYHKNWKILLFVYIGLCTIYPLSRMFVPLIPVSNVYHNSMVFLSEKNAICMLFMFVQGMLIFYKKGYTLIILGIIGLIYDIEMFVWCCFAAGLIFLMCDYSREWKKGNIVNILDKYSFCIYLGHATVMEIMSALQLKIGFSNIVLGGLDLIGTLIFVPVLFFVSNNISKLIKGVYNV